MNVTILYVQCTCYVIIYYLSFSSQFYEELEESFLCIRTLFRAVISETIDKVYHSFHSIQKCNIW